MPHFAATEDTVGRELWSTDMTPAGTVLSMEFAPARPASSNISEVTRLGSRVIFSANDGVNGTEPWVSDGTPAGTQMLGDLNPVAGAGSSPAGFTVFGNRLFFSAGNVATGSELWATDGTPAGTVMVRDINPGSGSSTPSHLTEWNGALYFCADVSGTGLWRTDGTAAGTVLVANIPILSIGTTPILALPTQLIVQATSQLYRSDGTTAGTTLIDPVNGVSVNYYAPALAVGGIAYFFGNRGGLFDLWRTDGTAAGTQHVYQFDNSTITFAGGGYWMTEFNNMLLVAAKHGVSGGTGFGNELFLSDGTTAGTAILKDISPFPDADSRPQGMVRAHDRVFFHAMTPSTGRELWMTDGTTAGTQQVAELNPGLLSGLGGAISAAGVGRRVAFGATQPATGAELWVSDGTPTGTVQMFELNPGTASGWVGNFTFTNLVVAGINAFFLGDNGITGPELFAFPAAWLEAAEAETFGAGCDGSGGAPSIGYLGVPALGDATFTVKASNALPSFPILLLASDTRTDLALGGGCTIYPTGPSIIVPSTASISGVGSVPVPAPNSPSLVGAELTMQWATIDPAGSFAHLAAFSDGLRIRIGKS